MMGLRSTFSMVLPVRAWLRKLGGDSRGAAALEFAILAPLFLMTLFAIFECGITFGAQQVLTNATDDIAREMRTGRIRRETLTSASLHDMYCNRMGILFAKGCPGLKIDVRNFETFDQVANEFATGIVPESFKVDLGPPLSKNVMRVFYEWPGVLTAIGDNMVDPKSGNFLLFATATWQNEPFD